MDLVQYKPMRRPKREGAPYKRRLLVRDWLHFAVWYVRLQKCIRVKKSAGTDCLYKIGNLDASLNSKDRRVLMKLSV